MTIGPSVLEERCRKARRRHTCVECGGVIDPGTLYWDIRGCWDGEWDHYRQCVPCNTAMIDGIQEHTGLEEEGPSFGGVWDWWKGECDSRDYTEDEFEAFKASYFEQQEAAWTLSNARPKRGD